jgi:hypothetical protein
MDVLSMCALASTLLPEVDYATGHHFGG